MFVYDGSGQLVAEYTAWATADPAPVAQVSYLTQDHLGSPRVVTNQNGEVIKRTDWMTFGEEVEFNKRTTGLGYEKDEESGLDFAQARYYNPKHGRYTSVDPLTASANVKNPQTFNRYSYVLNSPYKFTDPLGLISETTGACGTRCQGSNGPSFGLIGLYTGMSGNFVDPANKPTPESNTNSAGDLGEFTPETNGKIAVDAQSVESLTDVKAEIDGKEVFVKMEWDVTEGTLVIAGTDTSVKAFRRGKTIVNNGEQIQIGGEIEYTLIDDKGIEFKGKEANAMKKQVQKFAKNSNLNNAANCHGATFADGQYWIPNENLTRSVMEKMGYSNVTGQARQKDDVGLFSNNGIYVHSVRFNADVGTVRGKGGVEPFQKSIKVEDAWNKPGTLEVWRKIKK